MFNFVTETPHENILTTKILQFIVTTSIICIYFSYRCALSDKEEVDDTEVAVNLESRDELKRRDIHNLQVKSFAYKLIIIIMC